MYWYDACVEEKNIYSDSKYNSRNCEEEANKCMDEMDLDKEWIQ